MKKKKRNHSVTDYWQSNADLMSALVLVLLLVIMLLILYLLQIPEYTEIDPNLGDSYNSDRWPGDGDDDGGNHASEATEGRDDDDGGGGGGGETTEPTEETEPTQESTQETQNGGAGGSGEDEWGKSAVYTTVIDIETGRAIREEGITFELYEEQIENDGGALRYLNTYYPVKIEYRNFATTDRGVFYLPEKIDQGHYYFKQITEVEGYDMVEAEHFDVDDIYDWPEPYVVSIKLSPAKNIIPVRLEDAQTHQPIEDGTFRVNAAEDVITLDDTLRLAKGDLADTVMLDEEGYGVSKELYLGEYTVSQGAIPQYYASITEPQDVTVEKKNGNTPPTVVFSCEKTRISIQLTDEIYTNLTIEGAEFTLTCDGHPEYAQSAVTDANGTLVFTDLEKNAVYELRQISAPDTYRFDSAETKIYVSDEGRIDGEAELALELTNYIVRVNLGLEDQLFGKPISNENMALYDGADRLIRSWTTTGATATFEDLPAGRYYVILGGDRNKRYDYDFSDDRALQEFTVTVWTLENTAAATGIGVAALGGLAALAALLKKRKSKKQKEIGKEKKREE